MAITRFSGPIVSGVLQGSGDSNPTPGPSIFRYGMALADERFIQFGGDVTSVVPCLYGGDSICVADFAPSTLSTVNIVPAAVPTTAVAMTLAAAATGITLVAAGGFQLAAGFPIVPANCLVIDGLPGLIQLGQGSGGVSMYDPRTMSSRCLTITSVGTDTGAVMNIVGYDFYGNRMTCTTTMGSSGVPATTLKAFKFVQSCTPVGSLSGSNVSIGCSDIYGFQLAAWEWGNVSATWNVITATTNTGYTAPVATSPSTNLLGDVRGTYNVQTTASNGTRKLQAFVTPQAWNLTTPLLWGVTQA